MSEKYCPKHRTIEPDCVRCLTRYGFELSTSLSQEQARCRRLLEVMRPVPDALNDAITIYAPDECSMKTKAESRKRMVAGGGTLAYFVDIRQKIEAALAEEEAANDRSK